MSFYGKSIFGSTVAKQAPRAVGCNGLGLVAIDRCGSRGIVIYGTPQRTPVVQMPRQMGIFGLGNGPDGMGE